MRRRAEVSPDALSSALADLSLFSVGLTDVTGTLRPGGTSNHSTQVLLAVCQNPGISPSALAEHTRAPRPTVARALRALEDDGLVARDRDTVDRRGFRVVPTMAATRCVREFERSLASYFTAEFGRTRRTLANLGVAMPAAPAAKSLNALDVAQAMSQVGASYVEDVTIALHRHGVIADAERYALALLHQSACRPVELASALRLTTGGLAQLVDRLEQRALVVRSRPDDQDRRAVLVSLSGEGRDACTLMCQTLDRHASAVALALSMTMWTRDAGAA